MLKKFLLVSCLLILNNCSAPGTALLGPVFTGAKTGSVAHASLSFGTGKIVNEITEFNFDTSLKIKDKKLVKILKEKNLPNILDTYVVRKIDISEIMEPEPLP